MEELQLDLSKAIERLRIVIKDVVNTKIPGEYISAFKGQGLEFEEYRVYTPGDDANLIDWKATKRANQLLIKKFEEERNLNIFFLLDVSSTMVFTSIKKLKNEYAAELVASLAYVTLEVGDSVGLALFNDTIIKNLSPKRTKHQFYALLKSLVNPLFYGGGYDLANALSFAISSLEKNSLLIIVSDFIGLKGEWRRYMEIAAGKFDVIGVMIRDPTDRVLPEENQSVMLSDPLSEKQILITADNIKEKYEMYVQNQERMVKSAFVRLNCSFVDLSTDKEFIEDIITFFQKRARRFRGWR